MLFGGPKVSGGTNWPDKARRPGEVCIFLTIYLFPPKGGQNPEDAGCAPAVQLLDRERASWALHASLICSCFKSIACRIPATHPAKLKPDFCLHSAGWLMDARLMPSGGKRHLQERATFIDNDKVRVFVLFFPLPLARYLGDFLASLGCVKIM